MKQFLNMLSHVWLTKNQLFFTEEGNEKHFAKDFLEHKIWYKSIVLTLMGLAAQSLN